MRPLAMGGTDTDGNVQVLCRGCHQLKTATEFGRAV
ncbi:HNH endonuclease [Streptomyces sp. NBC_01390]